MSLRPRWMSLPRRRCSSSSASCVRCTAIRFCLSRTISGVVAEIADRIAVMRHGRIIEMGAARQVLTQPQHPYTKELLAAVPSLVPPAAVPGKVAPPAAAKPVLVVTELEKSYGRLRAVSELSFDLERGTTLSIVGESGCGKSSLARILVRLTAPTSGRVDVNGKCFLTLTGGELRSSCRAVQMIFQDPFGSLNPLRTAGAVLERAAVLAGREQAGGARAGGRAVRSRWVAPGRVGAAPCGVFGWAEAAYRNCARARHEP